MRRIKSTPKTQPQRYVRVARAREAGIPFSPHTLYGWRHVGKHPELFKKIGGAVFVDVNALDRLFEEASPY